MCFAIKNRFLQVCMLGLLLSNIALGVGPDKLAAMSRADRLQLVNGDRTSFLEQLDRQSRATTPEQNNILKDGFGKVLEKVGENSCRALFFPWMNTAYASATGEQIDLDFESPTANFVDLIYALLGQNIQNRKKAFDAIHYIPQIYEGNLDILFIAIEALVRARLRPMAVASFLVIERDWPEQFILGLKEILSLKEESDQAQIHFLMMISGNYVNPTVMRILGMKEPTIRGFSHAVR